MVTPGSTASPWSRTRPLNVLVACAYAMVAIATVQTATIAWPTFLFDTRIRLPPPDGKITYQTRDTFRRALERMKSGRLVACRPVGMSIRAGLDEMRQGGGFASLRRQREQGCSIR